MSEPCETLPREKSRARWYQFSLRSLLVMLVLVAGLLLVFRIYVAPFLQQRQTMAVIEQLGGRYQAEAGPKWMRRLYGEDYQELVFVDLCDCDDPAKYLDHILPLPRLKTLVVGGLGFTDEHLRRFQSMRTLQSLVLDSTGVTDAGLSSLQRALPELEIRRSQRRALAMLRGLGGHLLTREAAGHSRLRPSLAVEHFRDAIRLFRGFRRVPKQLADAQLVHLVGLPSLQVLYLGRRPFSDEGLAHLTRLPQLRVLYLNNTLISDAGLVHLKGLKGLGYLDLSDTNVTPAGAEQLRKALPRCQVIF